MAEIINEKAFEEFLEMAFQPSKNPRVSVYCEHCDDLTIIEKGRASCGHRPKWLDELETWAKKQKEKAT